MIDTGGTLVKASQMLKEKGARRVFCFATHGIIVKVGLFSKDAVSILNLSCLDEILVTNTIPMKENESEC